MIFGKGDSKTGTKPILKPEDAVQMKFAQRIQREVAREFIHFNVEINPDDFSVYTVTTIYLHSTIQLLSRMYNDKDDIELNLDDIFIIKPSTSVDEYADKTGNINCKILLGPKGEEIIKNIEKYESVPDYNEVIDIPIPEDEIERRQLEELEISVCKELLSYELAFKPQDFICHLCAITYMKRALVEACTFAKRFPDELILVNTHNMIEIEAIFESETEEIFVNVHPGVEYKLKIKSDFHTEDE